MGNQCSQESKVPHPKTKSRTLTNTMTEQIQKIKTQLKDFDKVRQLGKGAYGVVYLVKHKPTERYYAMKVIRKSQIKKESTQRHLQDERKVLEKVDSPFLVKLRYAFQDDDYLYLIVNYMNGGELFYHLRNVNKFNLETTKFYSAELLMGLKDLHELNIIYRDMKPENILLNRKGHLKLTDFGLSKIIIDDDRAYSLCGTPEYLAPEIITSKQGYTKMCDFYSYGCIVYEMLVGQPPFYSKDKTKMIQDRLHKKLDYPKSIDANAKDFISKLLQLDPNQRLGYKGISEVMDHQFFNKIHFDELLNMTPPYIFDQKEFKYFEKQDLNDQTTIPHQKNQNIIANFPGFTFEGQVSQYNKTMDATQIEF